MPAERAGPPATADAGSEPTADADDGPDGHDQPAGDDGQNTGQPFHEVLLASVPASLLLAAAERLLGPLREYDTRHNAELMPTLQSFLACDGSWAVCAALMYVHVNTVRYRIGRIEALTGRDLSMLANRVDFFLALRAT